MRVFVRLLRYVAPHRARLALVAVLALAGAAFELARPWPVKVVVDCVLADRPHPAWLDWFAGIVPGADSRPGLLLWAVAVGVAVVVGAALLTLAVRMLVMVAAQQMVFELSREVFAKLQRLSLAFHTRHSVGDLIQRVSNDVFVVQAAVSAVALPGVVSLLSLVGMFLVMARLDLPLALVAISAVPLLVVALAFFFRPMNRTSARQWSTQGMLSAFLEQSLSSVRAIQGFAREAYVQRKLEDRASDLADAYNRANSVGVGFNQATAVITGLGAAVLLGVGGARVLAGHLTLGDLLVILAYLAALYGPVSAFATAVGMGRRCRGQSGSFRCWTRKKRWGSAPGRAISAGRAER